jgi:phage tail tape-measure protein
MVVASAADIGSAALSGNGEQVGGAVGRLGGGLAGAALGAAAGSVVPVFGTAIGAAIGGVLGSLTGGSLGEALARKEASSIDTGGTLHIRIDNEGQPHVKSSSTNDARMNFDVDTGLLMGGGF